MQYIAITFQIPEVSEEKINILIALLDSLSYEGITEEDSEVIAYIPEDEFDRSLLEVTLAGMKSTLHAKIVHEEVIEEKNWNQEWEENFDPVIIDNRCVIRAPFHEKFKGFEYVINIEPKMSFGTGHHETTSLMISALLDMDIKKKTVLDMGCGTGVLAILSAMKEAKEVIGIDIDKWAVDNAIENALLNKVEVSFLKGSTNVIPDIPFDLILANINRNILIEQASEYIMHLDSCGKILLSGFLEGDVEMIESTYVDLGMTPVNHRTLGKWQMLEFVK
ncbi:MAG: 50S ribosomal protein L11 methyltransferase [Bacteroidales bacterium]|nr:50S ribosomal protein L11 methyltransferase [Bacteroidales bacterium]MBN2818307.1 50S ribosomal protein L11 methyltransferase [Bacteroidales bacterium]